MAEALPVLLAALGGAAVVVAIRELLPSLPELAAWFERAAAPLSSAGSENRSPSEAERRRLGYLAASALGLGAVAVTGSLPLAGLAAAGPALAGRAVAARRRRYRRRVEDDIPLIATSIADAVASGGSLRVALLAAGTATSGPTAIELAKLATDLQLGVPIRTALGDLGRRVGSPGVEMLLAAILSQERTGGDLAHLLRRHAAAAAERMRAERDAHAATAQARMTGGMVVAMPLVMALLVELAAPGFLSGLLSDSIATVLLVVAAILQVGGFLLIRKLGEVRR